MKYVVLRESIYLGCSEWSSAVWEVVEDESDDHAIERAAAELGDFRDYGRDGQAQALLLRVDKDLTERLNAALPEIWDRAKAAREAEEAAKKELERRAAAIKRAEKLRTEIAAFAPSEQLSKMQQELAEVEALLGMGVAP